MTNVLILQDLADILYKVAEEGSHVDPQKVEQILRVPPNSSKRKSLAEETITGRCDSHLLRICENRCKICNIPEYIPVGCVTSVAVAVCRGGGVRSQGVSAPGWNTWSQRGCLVPGGVPGPSGGLLPGAVCSLGVGIPTCTEADPPRQTHRCKNMTFATSLRTVKIVWYFK